jgi:hypothetical protein
MSRSERFVYTLTKRAAVSSIRDFDHAMIDHDLVDR